MPDLSNFGQYGTLVASVPYGQHIGLTCKNHLHLRWSTKNIAPIGARNIFYSSWPEPECACSCGDLIVLKDEDEDDGAPEDLSETDAPR